MTEGDAGGGYGGAGEGGAAAGGCGIKDMSGQEVMWG